VCPLLHCGNRGYEKSDSKKGFKLLKSTHLCSKISHIQGDPKKFLKKSHHSCNNVIGRIKLPFTAIYSLTSQTLAELNNLSFLILNTANFCINAYEIGKKVKNTPGFEPDTLSIHAECSTN